MTREVASVPEDATYRDLAELMSMREISALPVVDDAGHVLGVVSEADLLPKVEFATAWPAATRLVERRRRDTMRTKTAGDLAVDLMTRPAITIEADASVAMAARLMEEEGVKRLPVVDPDGILIGIVSRRDLLRVHLQADETVRRAVAEQVLREWFRVGPPQVLVDVRHGVVTLTGELERRRQVQLAEHLTRTVDGVVDVVNRLRYRVDDTRPGHRSGASLPTGLATVGPSASAYLRDQLDGVISP